MVKSKALRKFLVPFGIFLVLVTVAIIKKMRTVAAGEGTTVVLCHVPPGNPENAHAIEVGESAVDAHLEHGDYLGECEGDDGNDDGDDDGGAENVTLCHVPPGNPENAHTIEVGAAAVDAHLEHGDYLGECEGEEGDGNGGGENVTICHIPPGNPENAHTIEVSESAVAAHLAHGDILGACEGDDDGGDDDGSSDVVAICHIPPGNPENAHTIEISESAVPAHLAHGDTLGECPEESNEGDDDGNEDDGNDDGDGNADGDEDGNGNADGDEDGDGVNDSDDLCPGTPPNTPVDEVGCELDDDGEQLAGAPDDDSGNADGDEGSDGVNDADGEEMAGARDDGSGDDNNSRPESNNGDSGNQQGSGGDGDKNSLFIQMQPGATGAFDGEIDGELNLCGYITPVSFTMMFAGLLLMRVGTGRRRF